MITLRYNTQTDPDGPIATYTCDMCHNVFEETSVLDDGTYPELGLIKGSIRLNDDQYTYEFKSGNYCKECRIKKTRELIQAINNVPADTTEPNHKFLEPLKYKTVTLKTSTEAYRKHQIHNA